MYEPDLRRQCVDNCFLVERAHKFVICTSSWTCTLASFGLICCVAKFFFLFFLARSCVDLVRLYVLTFKQRISAVPIQNFKVHAVILQRNRVSKNCMLSASLVLLPMYFVEANTIAEGLFFFLKIGAAAELMEREASLTRSAQSTDRVNPEAPGWTKRY